MITDIAQFCITVSILVSLAIIADVWADYWNRKR